MPHPLLIFSQSDYLIRIVAKKLHTQWPTVQIQISGFFRSQLIWIYTVCKCRYIRVQEDQGLHTCNSTICCLCFHEFIPFCTFYFNVQRFHMERHSCSYEHEFDYLGCFLYYIRVYAVVSVLYAVFFPLCVVDKSL